MNRNERKLVAEETLKILDRGYYELGHRIVNISELYGRSVAESKFIPEDEAISIPAGKSRNQKSMVFYGSSVGCLREMYSRGLENIGVLNFASAKHPGGGFQRGSMSQEESLAYSSGLYGTLVKHPEFYDLNQRCKTPVYLGNAIFSPEVVFFRDENLELLEQPFTASVLSLPAVNMTAVMKRTGGKSPAAESVMRQRMGRVLDIFAMMGVRHIALGDYGCGVFGNDRRSVRNWWNRAVDQRSGWFKSVWYVIFE